VKSVLVGKLDNKKLYYIIDSDGTRNDGVLVDDLGKKELINFWQFVRSEPRVKRMMNSDFHKFLWQDSLNQREKALWNNVFIAKAFPPDDSLLMTVPVKDDILGRKSVLHGLMNRALDFDIARRSNTLEEKAIQGRIGSAIGRAFKPRRNTGKRSVRRSMAEIEGVLDPKKRRDKDGDGMIFDGTWREMPDPSRTMDATAVPSGLLMNVSTPEIDGPLISVDAKRKRISTQIRAISSSTGVDGSLRAVSDFVREKFASKFGFKKIKEKLQEHEVEAFEHWNDGVIPKTVGDAHEILSRIHPTYIMDRPAKHSDLQKHVSFDFLMDKDASEDLESWEISLLASHLLFMKESENLEDSPIGHNFYYVDLDRAEKISKKVAEATTKYILNGSFSPSPTPRGFDDFKIEIQGRRYRVSSATDMAALRAWVTGQYLLRPDQADQEEFKKQITEFVLHSAQQHVDYESGVSGYWGFKPGAKINADGSVSKLYAPGHMIGYQRAEGKWLSQIGLPREEAADDSVSILDLLSRTLQTGSRISITAWLADEDEITNKKLSDKKEKLSSAVKKLEKELRDLEGALRASDGDGVLSPEQNINIQKNIVETRQEIKDLIGQIEEIEKNIDVDTPERRNKKARKLSELLALNTAHHEHGHGHENIAIYNEIKRAVLARRDARISELKAKSGKLSLNEQRELNTLSSAVDHRELWDWYLFDQIQNGPETTFKETLSSALEEIAAYGLLERYETLFNTDPEKGFVDGFYGQVLNTLQNSRQRAVSEIANNGQSILLLQRLGDSRSLQIAESIKEKTKELKDYLTSVDFFLDQFKKATESLKSQTLFDPKTRSTIKVSDEQKKKFNKLITDYARILSDMPDSVFGAPRGSGVGKILSEQISQAKITGNELTVGQWAEILSAGRILSKTNVGFGARFITMKQDVDTAPGVKRTKFGAGASKYGSAVDGFADNSNQFAVIKDMMRNGLPELFGEGTEENAAFMRALQSTGMTTRASHLAQSAQSPTAFGFDVDPQTGRTEPGQNFDPVEILSHLANLGDVDSFFAEGRNSSDTPHDGSILLLGDGANIGLENFIASLYSDEDIMEKARTKPWGDLWDSLSPEQKIGVRRAIAKDVRAHMTQKYGAVNGLGRGHVLWDKISQQFSFDNLDEDERVVIKQVIKKMAVAGGESYVERGYRKSTDSTSGPLELLSFLGEYGYRELASELNSAMKSGINILGGQSLTPDEQKVLTKYMTWLLHGSREGLEQSVKSGNHIFVDNKRTIVGTRWTK
jgi:hypothetical protein